MATIEYCVGQQEGSAPITGITDWEWSRFKDMLAAAIAEEHPGVDVEVVDGIEPSRDMEEIGEIHEAVWEAGKFWATSENYSDLAGKDSIQFEHDTLNIGEEFLPEFARAVRDGGEGTPEYWAWLIDAFEQAESEARWQAEERSESV